MELELDTAAGKCFLFANSSESICAGRVRCMVSACALLQPKRTPISAPKRSRGDGRNLRAQLFVQLLGRLPGRGRNPRPFAIGLRFPLPARLRFPLPARIGNRDSIPLTYIGYDRAPATLAGTIADRPQTAAAVPKAPVSFLKLLNLKIESRRFSKADISWCLYPGWPRTLVQSWDRRPDRADPPVSCTSAVRLWAAGGFFFSIWPSDYYE